MTAGHRHRVVRLRPGSPLLPLLHLRLATGDRERAERSSWVWGPIPRDAGPNAKRWELTVLGALHRLTGLTVQVPPPEPAVPPYAVSCPYRCPWWCITGAGVAADVAVLRHHLLSEHKDGAPW